MGVGVEVEVEVGMEGDGLINMDQTVSDIDVGATVEIDFDLPVVEVEIDAPVLEVEVEVGVEGKLFFLNEK